MPNQGNYYSSSRNPILGLLIFVAVIIGLYYITTSIYYILGLIGPILLIITAILDHKVIIDYGKYLLNLLRTNFLAGAVLTLLTIVAYPIVCAYLFGKVMLKRKISKLSEQMGDQNNPFFQSTQKPQDDSFTDYEVLEEDILKIEEPSYKNNEKQNYDKFF